MNQTKYKDILSYFFIFNSLTKKNKAVYFFIFIKNKNSLMSPVIIFTIAPEMAHPDKLAYFATLA